MSRPGSKRRDGRPKRNNCTKFHLDPRLGVGEITYTNFLPDRQTKLLDVLAGKKDSKGASGHLLQDGQPLPHDVKCLMGYVVQDDVVMSSLSVRENLALSAALRLPSSMTPLDRQSLINKIIRELRLHRCADTKVGDEFIPGVSGGERKRGSIGMELIISPPVLFLDEPTTGLNSSTASTTLFYLKS